MVLRVFYTCFVPAGIVTVALVGQADGLAVGSGIGGVSGRRLRMGLNVHIEVRV